MKTADYAKKMINEYSAKEESKLDRLKALDKKVKFPIKTFAYVFGTIACLIMGTGMCLAMKVLGDGIIYMIAGIVTGVLGIVLCGINYPVYLKKMKRRKELFADQIIEISNEIINQN